MAKVIAFDVGSEVGTYRIVRNEPLEHHRARYVELVHQPTGARHIHIESSDVNKTFGVAFLTVPEDSTGVAHILEHVTLSGSRRFPVKDPFFAMLPRSLKTFMNAMTSSDRTVYPFSTRNEKDFFNLLEVYLDATFFPLLTEEAFTQEGHRLEFEDPDDPASGLRYRGVVFNEMKGANSTPARAMGRAVGRALMPDLTYANDSGGDSEVMPSLTWDDLKGFQRHHYHPSNAYFFTYGDLPLERVLERIDALALAHFERSDTTFTIPDQPRYSEPIVYRSSFPLAEQEDPAKKCQVLLTWLTVPTTDSLLVLAFEILSDVLLGNPGAPLHHALISSGLGDALADGSGFRDGTREAVFGAGLKGVRETDADSVERIVLDTLDRLATDCVPDDLVDAAVHQLEIAQRESAPNQGLRVLFQLSTAYVYGGDPYRALQIDDDLERLAAERRSGRFFEKLIRTHLLDNQHRARVVLVPDQAMEREARERELAKLAGIESALSDDDKARIVERSHALKERQDTRSDLSCLPTLELSDVPTTVEDVPLTRATGASPVVLALQPTNGISYIDVRADAAPAGSLLDALPLFAYALTRVGAAGLDHTEMAGRIEAYTGGVGASAGVRTAAAGRAELSIVVSTRTLVRNHAPCVDIVRDVLTTPRFERGRVSEILAEYRTRFESMIVGAGHQFATTLACSGLSTAGAIRERLNGLAQLAYLKGIEGDAIEDALSSLDETRRLLFTSANVMVGLTGQDEPLAELRALADTLSGALPAGGSSNAVTIDAGEPKNHARTTAVPVAYNAKVFRAARHDHEDAPALAVLGQYARSTFLHREIRESGGAYGAYATYDPESGLFAFQSYRDPHIVRTFEVFGRFADHVRRGPDPQDVKEAILSTCGALDPALSPSMKARRRLSDDLAGYTPEMQRQFKAGVLQVGADDLVRVTQTYLRGDAVLCTISNPAKVDEANREMGGVFEIAPI